MILQILGAIFLLGICVFIHELGHFLVGKWVGVRAKIFSIGFGRGLFFKKVKGTIYQVTAIPLGGYVQFYGDDITKKHESIKKGDFFSVGPWRRMALAFGGPLFSILFGFLVIGTLIGLGWKPITNRVQVVSGDSPAAAVGIKDGDRIVSVNGNETDSFEKVVYHISLSPDPLIKLGIDRGGEALEIEVDAVVAEPGLPRQIGVRPEGERYLLVQQSRRFEHSILLPGDKVYMAGGQPVGSIDDLRVVLDKQVGGDVEIEIRRQESAWLSPADEEIFTVRAPVKRVDYFRLTDVRDIQTGKSIDMIEVGSWSEAYKNIHLEGKSYSDWESFQAALLNVGGGGAVEAQIGTVDVSMKVEAAFRGMLGISLAEAVEPAKADLADDVFSKLYQTFDYTVFATKSTLLGLYRIIEGKLSFRKSISGPVKIMAIAAETVNTGWEHYWFLLANITIILGVMNLLPIPILDGGHIVFYLVEALYRPLPISVIAGSMRVGTILLVGLGIYVIGIDIWDVFLRRFLGE